MTRMELFSGRNEESQESNTLLIQESRGHGDPVIAEGDESSNTLNSNGGFVLGVGVHLWNDRQKCIEFSVKFATTEHATQE